VTLNLGPTSREWIDHVARVSMPVVVTVDVPLSADPELMEEQQ